MSTHNANPPQCNDEYDQYFLEYRRPHDTNGRFVIQGHSEGLENWRNAQLRVEQ